MKQYFSRKGVILIAGVAVIGLVAVTISTGPFSRQSDAEFYKSIGCDRITLEVRNTDKYCGNHKLYEKECTGIFTKKSPDCKYH